MQIIQPDNWIAARRLLESVKPVTEHLLHIGDEPITGIDIALDLHNRFDTCAMGSEAHERTVSSLLDGKLVLIDSKNQFVGYCPMTFNNTKL